MAAYEEDENWPEIFVKVGVILITVLFEVCWCSLLMTALLQVYIEDSLGERIWVDSCHCKNFVDNIQTAFGTKMPPKSMLLQADTGRSGGDLSAGGAASRMLVGQMDGENKSRLVIAVFASVCLGSSPHPSTPDEDDSQAELLIAEEKLSPEDEGQIMPR